MSGFLCLIGRALFSGTPLMEESLPATSDRCCVICHNHVAMAAIDLRTPFA